VEIEKQGNEAYTQLKAVLPVSGRSVNVEVWHDVKYNGQYTVAVNWSSLGSVCPEDAIAYAILIQNAALVGLERQRLGG